jgi:hypothetical protein
VGYQPFTNDYSADVAGQTRVFARQAAKRARINAQMSNGNLVLGQLVTECCADPAYGGQGYYDDAAYSSADTTAAIASLVPGTSASTAAPLPSVAGSSPNYAPPTSGMPSVPLTPVDILTNTRGWPTRANGRPWPRPRISNRYAAAAARNYPDYGPTSQVRTLVPDCPCFGSGPPMVIPIPALNPPTNSPNPTPPSTQCPYPGCSTGNVCLDLVTGCVSNSQVDPAQTLACTKAGYGTFGNSGAWLSAIMLGCGGNLPHLGTPLPNPPQATGAMAAQLTSANNAGVAATQKLRGMSGLGQDDSSQLGGLLAIVAAAGILVWASKKW